MPEHLLYFILLVVLSSIAFAFLYFIPTSKLGRSDHSVPYFRLFYLCNAMGFAQFIIGDSSFAAAVGNAFFVLSVHSLVFGLKLRTMDIRPLNSQIFAAINAVAIFFFTWVTLTLESNPRIFIVSTISINMGALYLYSFYICLTKDVESIRTKTLRGSLIISAILISLSWLPLYLTNDTVLHLRGIFASVTVIHFVLFGGLLSLLMSDVIHFYYTNSITDSLSGLYNRRHFTDVGRDMVNSAKRHKFPICCVLCDIDRFKSVNDTHGHDVGDEVIKTVAKLLKKNARPRDLVARIGGEEYAILLDNTDIAGAVDYAERVRRNIKKLKMHGNDVTISITASFGIFDASESTIQDALKNADMALYRSKRNGRDQVSTQL
ncbi:MAG: GGDEF domain-containing protein [Pseudomonadota bacterium]